MKNIYLILFTVILLSVITGCGDSPKQEFKKFDDFNNSKEDNTKVKVGNDAYSKPKDSEFILFFYNENNYDTLQTCTATITSTTGTKSVVVNDIKEDKSKEYVGDISTYNPIQVGEEIDIKVKCYTDTGTTVELPKYSNDEIKTIFNGGSYLILEI